MRLGWGKPSTLAAAFALACASCEFVPSRVNDLAFVSLRPSSEAELRAADWDSRGPAFTRDALTLTLSTTDDLRSKRRQRPWYGVYLAVDLCPRQKGYWIGFSKIFEDGVAVDSGSIDEKVEPRPGPHTYQAVFRYDDRRHEGDDRALDQAVPINPQDLCFWVEVSGWSNVTFTSATGTIPKDALTAALAQLPR